MTSRDLTLEGPMQIILRGRNRVPVPDVADADATLWRYQGKHPADGSNYGVAVLDPVKNETERPLNQVAAEARADEWIAQNPAGDPGLSTRGER